MGICQPEKVDVSRFIAKGQSYKRIPLRKANQFKMKHTNCNSEISSSLNSTSINNVLFNNTKRTSNLNYKFKNIPPKLKKGIRDYQFKNINYNNNLIASPLSRKYFNNKGMYTLPKPSRLRRNLNPNFSIFSDNSEQIDKLPSDNIRSKFRKSSKKESQTSRTIISISPRKIINSNSFNNLKSPAFNIINEKPQYLNKKVIIDDEDDTNKILFNLEEEINIKKNKKENNSLILSFDDIENKEEEIELYYLNEFNFNSNNEYSTGKDFDGLIQSKIFKNKINLTNLLLFLPERQWYKEIIELSELIKINRIKDNNDPLIFNDCLNKFIKIYNHFNHLVWALSYFYSKSLLYNKSALFKNKKINLPPHNSLEWIKGFEWKGLHIRIFTYEQSKKLIREIKALYYILFDYLQLFNTNNKNKKIKYSNLLSNEIVFPFMSYAYVGGVVLYVTVEIKKLFYDENFLKTNINIKDENKIERMRKSLNRNSIKLGIKIDNNNENFDLISDEDIDNISFEDNILNEEINLANYSKEDLSNTKILHKITENNLLKIFDDSIDNNNKEKLFKFILINTYSLLPTLFKEDDKTIYQKFNQLNCIDIKNEFDAPRFINLTKINNLDKDNEMGVVSKLIRVTATKESIGVYKNKIDDINYKIIYDNSKKGNKINEQITKFFVQFPLIQNSELSRLLTTEYLNVGNLNIILNKYNMENTQEIPDRNIIIYRTTFQTKMKYSIISFPKETIFPKSTEEYISYFKKVCQEMTENSYKIKKIDNLFDFCEKFGLNKKFLPFCLEFIEDEYLRNLIQIYLYVSFIKKFYDYHEGQTFIMRLAIFERNKDESIINSSNFSKDNSFIEMQKQFIADIIKLIFLPVESLKESKPQESFSKIYFQNISFFIFLKMLKIKNYEKYINFKSSLCQLDIKDILIGFNEISRNNPFLFIDSLEKILNIRINPFIKYRASIDINNLKTLNRDNIDVFCPKIKSFVNFSTLTSYIFTDFASNSPSLKNNTKKQSESDFNTILSNIDLDYYYPFLIFKNPIEYDKNNNFLLKNYHYYIYNEEMMNKFCYVLEHIFDGIISYNGEKELMLFKAYLYSLLTSIFCHNNVNEAKEIIVKIKESLKYQYLFSFTQYSVLYLLEALISIDNISHSEELYSLVLILSLLNEGDIRNQNCLIHQFMMFPLFQLSIITALYNNHYLNEYLNELFFILDKKLKEKVEFNERNKKINLGYYKFPFESSLLSPSDSKINKDYLDDIKFKSFICKVIIDYFYSVDNLMFDDNFLIRHKIKIKDEKEEDNENLINNKNVKIKELYNSFNKYIIEYLLDQMSYQKYAPSNIVISFGNNNYSQTAQVNSERIMTPRIIYSLLNKKIQKIFSGYDFNYAIDENDKIYSWGLNSHGECGIEDIEIIKIPKEIIIPELELEEKIINITCGNKSTFFLSNKNKIYLSGYNLISKEIYATPKRVEFSFEKEKISQIELGEKYYLFLTSQGNVFYFEQEEENEQVKCDNEINQLKNLRSIQFISCGYKHFFAIDKNDIVFCWGENERGQLGLDVKINYVSIPKIIILDHVIDKIFCGKDFSIFLTEKKEILVCGKNDEGELGIGKEAYSKFTNNKNNNDDCIKPIQVDQFFNLEIIKVACGENNCVAMVKDSTTKIVNVWSWGGNKKGQLGLGNNIEKSRPKPVPALLEYINHIPKDISCGKNHCLVLLERKDEIKTDDKKIINDLILKYNKF